MSKKNKPREYTTDEIREQFLVYINKCIDIWEKVKNVDNRERLEGLVHSILATIDGEAMFPEFILAPNPHPDDKKYSIRNGEDYYPENNGSKVKSNISGSLHEVFRDYSNSSTKE